MIFGSNDVYEPVAAYDVGQYTRNGIISGGSGGNVTTTQGVTFTWVYDPGEPEATPSGFTGQGWFAEIDGSPIWYSIKYCSMTLEGILAEFAAETRTTLDDVFINWQSYVNEQASNGNDVVQQFQQKLGWTCWSNLNT